MKVNIANTFLQELVNSIFPPTFLLSCSEDNFLQLTKANKIERFSNKPSMNTNCNRAIASNILTPTGGTDHNESGNFEIKPSSSLLTWSAKIKNIKINAAIPELETIPPKFHSRENQPRFSAICSKNVIDSNRRVWIIPSVIRITERLSRNSIVPDLSFENLSKIELIISASNSL